LGALDLALLVLRVALAVARVAPDRVPVPVAGRDLEAAGGVALVVGRAAERLVLGALVGLDLATVHTVEHAAPGAGAWRAAGGRGAGAGRRGVATARRARLRVPRRRLVGQAERLTPRRCHR